MFCVAVITHFGDGFLLRKGLVVLEYELIKLIVCMVLIYIIIDDLRNYRIRNEAIGVLIALFLLEALVRGAYVDAGVQFLIALIFFFLLLIPYAWGLLGGGDVKLLGVAFLWLGDAERLTFSVFFFFLTLVYVVAAKCRAAPSRGRASVVIPFAPSIAGAWLLTMLTSSLESYL
jgi:prepilin peptidase CpaA